MDCVFCKIVSGQIPAVFLAQTSHSVAFLDAFPLARGHTLVIPKRHCQKIQEMTDEENSDLFLLVRKMTAKVDEITGATLVAVHNGRDAGQEVPHVHVHIVPRKEGDSAGPIHSMFGQSPKPSESELEELQDRLKI